MATSNVSAAGSLEARPPAAREDADAVMSASTTPTPDVVALAASADPGYVDIPGNIGAGAFAVATVNVGAAGAITATADTGSTGHR